MSDKCEALTGLLPGYIDGELPAEESARVEAHAASCEICRKELERLNITVELLRNLPRYQASTRLLAEVRNEIKKRRTIFDRARPFLKLAGVLALAALAFFFLKNGIPPAGQPVTTQKIPGPSKNGIKRPALKKDKENKGISASLPTGWQVVEKEAAGLPSAGGSSYRIAETQVFQNAYEGETFAASAGNDLKNRVIGEEGEWKAFYASVFPKKSVPQVDFSGKLVVAVYGSGALSIISAEPFEEKLFISYRDTVKNGTTSAYCCLKVVEKTGLEIIFKQERK